MPEFEARPTSVPQFSSPLGRADGAGAEREGAGIPQREGLPPGFRMRHDAHYVDQLTARGGPQPHIRAIPVREIESPRTPSLQGLEPLVRSIARLGVIQPLVVRARSGRFELIAGGRRLRAAALAGLTEVPCLVHACDEERARGLKEAAALGRTEPAPTRAGGALSSVALGELRRSFGTIASCLHLMGDREAPLRDRVALDLIRTEAHRAHRLVQAIHLLTCDPALSPADVSVRALLGHALDACEPERRLSGTAISLDLADGAHDVRGDPEWLGAGLAAALGGVMALVQGANAPAFEVRLSGSASRPGVLIEMAQRVVTVPEWAVARFFDATWTDRPGGYQAAMELAAARLVVERHGGSVDLLAGERGGCRLALALPYR